MMGHADDCPVESGIERESIAWRGRGKLDYHVGSGTVRPA